MLKTYTDYRLGGNPRIYVARKPVSDMIIPDGILNVVGFICYHDKKHQLRFAGTAFFVLYDDKESGLTFSYTVTALHVIKDITDNSLDGKAILRLNKRNGDFNTIETSASDWVSASQEQEFTDVAVLDWSPDSDIYDSMGIYSSMVVTQDLINDQSVGVGNEVIIVGLFIKHEGKRRNVPIVRYGNVAMTPDEKVRTRYGDTIAYLIESRSIGGLSGSPVFVRTDRHIKRETPTGSISSPMLLWLGLIHGHYQINEPATDMLVEDTAKREAINMGIAIVVPAFKVMQTIHEDNSLRKSRKKRVDDEDDASLPVADSATHEDDTQGMTKKEFERALRKISRPNSSLPDSGKSETSE